MIIGLLNESIMNILQNVSLLDGAEGLKFFGVKLMDVKDFSKLLVRFLFNLFFVVLLVRGVYYPAQRRKDFLFSYLL
jgi:hypothetical protein